MSDKRGDIGDWISCLRDYEKTRKSQYEQPKL